MQGKHWIMIATSCQSLFLPDSFCRDLYSFFKQTYKEMLPEPLQSHPSVCGFYTAYAGFLLFDFRQEVTTGDHDVITL